ncbi:MAG TPA: ABC transporter permease subunit [Xanthobacteraceae bacterium]|jgi:NitT/TauT family transport system permease protein|nr:MAG: lipid kinase [Rhizobiales bacterium 12-66-7]OZB03260.1 MAG: lipid kinase [Rhizobiales bacterium 39-66-18]HQS07790.1 ABC transporter permease subunit [Xanthobacteraceae bacterium]HQS47966.1 ABC transporter permease subunit [Xanthobacteraceae bacterium]
MRLINRRPDRTAGLLLAILPFALVLLAYVLGSAERLAENPADKLLPSLATLGDAIVRVAFTADARTGDYILWADTLASLERLASALALSTLIALVVGLLIGLLPGVRALLASFVGMVSMVPPLALLPILFIVLGLGETSKIALIVIGVTPFLIRDLAMRVQELPREQIIKAETLGATTWQIALRIVLPQILPRLIDGVRLSLGPAFLFLIAAEAIAADSGLGYRIFLVRRYLSMDVILPYVAWITLLSVIMDFALAKLRDAAFPWFGGAK